MIRAECHSDDRVIEISFDAEPWFAQASDEEINALVSCGWGGDYPADAVADFFEQTSTMDLFVYIGITQKQRLKPSIGFECHVNPDDAEAWIMANRPQLDPR